MVNPKQLKKLIRKCQRSPVFFIKTFCKIQHPRAGIIPFNLFDYQIDSIRDFMTKRFNIYRKCRQCARDDSQVWTPSGPIRIDSIKNGDQVYSLSNDGVVVSVVEDVYNNGISDDLVEVNSKNGHKSFFTSNHEFKTPGGWRNIGSLNQGDRIIEINDRMEIAESEIKSVKPTNLECQVYDLRVPPYNNYIVDGAVVHNCGISTLSGAFALWYAMFFGHKTVLIVSKRDKDAKDFLKKNVKLAFGHLPSWMQQIWSIDPAAGGMSNEHKIGFPNGSTITSLTSSPDTLRSNASSLNIIDEAAFMPHMDDMWSGGWPTLQHGGRAIVISTVKGVGNWYWRFWTDAESNQNDFNPIVINWWDMTWKIPFKDEFSGNTISICPTAGLRECKTPDEIEKFGPYWSPWLDTEYRNLTEKGDDSKFRQEVLAEFVGTGHTVLSRQTLSIIGNTVAIHGKNYKTVGLQDYVNPTTEEREVLDFRDELWVWKKPNKGNEETGEPPHQYVLGCDVATGEGQDFSAIEVFDINEGEQVAELKIKVRPKVFAKMIDFIGRWYNNALAVVENTGIGKATCQELFEDLAYPNIYRSRRKRADLKVKAGHLGFSTTGQSKPLLDKCLIDGLGEDGYVVCSSRLYKEAMIYVQLTETKTGAEPGPGNNDDLVIATALSLIGVGDAVRIGGHNLLPYHNFDVPLSDPTSKFDLNSIASKNIMLPFNVSSEVDSGKIKAEDEIRKFQQQIGGITLGKTKNNIRIVRPKKHNLTIPKRPK